MLIEGDWVDDVIGLFGMCVEIVMMCMLDGYSWLEIFCFFVLLIVVDY